MAKIIELQDGLNQQKAHDFYREVLTILAESKIPFLVGGGFALRLYTDIIRDTKDLDIFCRSADCPSILKLFQEKGFKTELTDARWLAKIKYKGNFIDIIFNNPSNHCTVDDAWFKKSVKSELLDKKVLVIPAETLIWSKLYVQNRERYDGADINHIILRYGKKLDWHWLWTRVEIQWQLVLAQVMSFQFVYPTERDLIPKWLVDELLRRVEDQYEMPLPKEKICRGPLIDQTQYATDITEWEYKVVTIRSV
jgi:hypothetical protein